MVEVLRHTGIRIEELTDLSHHSLIQPFAEHRELIPLLQITPSKTDAERLLMISPELADVLSTMVARIRGDRPDVPLVVSYDKNERVYNPPRPLLFQWRRRLDHRPVTATMLRTYLDHALTEISVKDAAGRTHALHLPRLLTAVHRPTRRRPPRHKHHHGYRAVYPEEVINGPRP